VNELIVSSGPHIREKESNEMLHVLVALVPAFIFGIYLFGFPALIVCFSAIAACVIFEMIMLKAKKQPFTKKDVGSAVVTGLLFAFCVSSAMPWWIMVIGAFVAIVLVKHAFGGLGFNIFNPALVSRAFLLSSWPVLMTSWNKPFDAVTTATPLGLLKEQQILTDYMTMLIGNHAGSIGETSAIALLLGGLYLLIMKVIDHRIPVGYMFTVAIFGLIFRQDVVFHMLAGGLLLGAFFMATDPVTSPVSKPGRWVFGIGCGIITMVIRLWGGYPEGVCYSILVMNATVPLIDRYMQGRIYGRKRWNIL